MTTTLSERGQLVIPKGIRKRLSLLPGDDFEVDVEGQDTVRLKRIARHRQRGLGKHLLSCPVELTVSERASRPLRAFRRK
jgi:AbrB family looped-hinge helix DNA binding protein